MRRARLTFKGAFHHCLNRGHGRERILAEDEDKKGFLKILAEAGKRLKIRVLHRHGGNGHVFQGRYKSAVIQEDGYLVERDELKMNALGALYRHEKIEKL